MRIAVISNTAWYLHNFRTNLMSSLKLEGHDVIAVSPKDEFAMTIEKSGIKHVEWCLSGSSVNPITEIRAIWQLFKLLQREKIDIVLTYTPKGNIYGSIASQMAGAGVINNISGLGRAFVKDSVVTSIVKFLYRIAFRTSRKVFFQNEDDLQLFVKLRIVRKSKVERIPGSGVDLNRFVPRKEGALESNVVFLLVARMLWDKGIGEFIDAARRIKKIYPNTTFRLLGFLNADNPSSISQEQVSAWVEEGVVEYLGSTGDVAPIIAQSSCVVLPSYYREGVPRSLLEAASMAIPIITTDFPGCRDAVDQGISGILCRPKDVDDLVEKMLLFVSLSKEQQREMGKSGRRKMEKEFDEQIVIYRYLSVLNEF